MAICMDTRFDHHNHSMIDNYASCETFESDFYNGLCEDLARELDFPGETDLRRISQLELFGSSWDTDPYKQLLLRCLDHSLPKLREHPPSIPRSRSFSIDYTDREEDEVDDDDELDMQLPTNPPPSPALSPQEYILSSQTDKASMFGISAEDELIDPMMFEKIQLLPPAAGSHDMAIGGSVEPVTGEYTVEQYPRRPSVHRRVASTGLLATVVTGDGSVTWHFKKF